MAGAITGTGAVADGLAASEIAYDAPGNTTRLADMSLSYDANNRPVGTSYDDGTSVSIVRDGTGRVVSRSTDPAGSAPLSTVRYLYAGESDTPWAIVAAAGEATYFLALPGGVSVDVPVTGTST